MIRIPIRIDRDGIWYYRGAEMFRRDILALFFEALGYDGENGYYVEMKGVRTYIDVEDTPFVVNSVSVREQREVIDTIEILLNDNSTESLDVVSLKVGADDVLYCSVKGGTFDARFSRAAYYQLARHIQHQADEFFLETRTGRHRIRHNVRTKNAEADPGNPGGQERPIN
ncbi:MAG: DUF1285 domain-containing protein [Syntrophales bacterium]|nr:DUF1285 domain-containing protein [Syntrophales bacterium]MCK9527241.1 DUF1285 domain-containing protein [Syntrophales bacterium]MDX9921289.1 DUF1285 domain-containing protein [Syntrophales bacterium]